MQHTLTPFLIRALSKTEGESRRDREGEREGVKERGQTEGKGGETESVALISWQFGTGPDSPGKATDVSEAVRHARRAATHVHTQLSHMHAHTAHRQTTYRHTYSWKCSYIEREDAART